jgi:hypothetical protein
MEATQEKKLSMFVVFAMFIQGALSTILAAMPNFNFLFDSFLQKVNEINVLNGKQMLDRKGNKIEKIFVRESLCIDGDLIASNVMAYASYTSNFLLFSEVKYTERGLLKMAATSCKAACLIIHEKATECLPNLGEYGITQIDLDRFKDKIELFDLTIPKSKAGIQSKKLATEQLKVRFKEASELIVKMYLLARSKRHQFPEFYKGFENAKRIDKPSFDVISARGVVVDEEGNRIGKVTMECEALKFKRKTSATGGFYLKHMPDGVYDYNFSRPGWELTKVEMVFYKSTRFEVRVVMKRLVH